MSRGTRLFRGLFASLALVVGTTLVAPPAAGAAPNTPASGPAQQASPSAPVATPAQQSAPNSGGFWVQNFEVADLWSGPDEGAVAFGLLRKFSFLHVERSAGKRFYVYNPRSNNFAYIDASVVGPSGAPPANYLDPIKEVARLDVPARLVGKAGIYAEPAADEAVFLHYGSHNEPVQVEAQVKGDGSSWYRLDSGEFVSGEDVRLPDAPTARYPGKWIDASLTEPTIVTAYEGNHPVASALAIHGTAAWPTPVGTFYIQRRVYNETMSSEGLGIPRNAPGGYYVTNVLFTQYFTGDGASIHYNYWSGNFGYSGSHGCLGMSYDDALWFWNWVDVGTPVVSHY